MVLNHTKNESGEGCRAERRRKSNSDISAGDPIAKHEQHLNRIDCEKEVTDCAGSNDGDIQRGRDAVHV
jgi:hypothetical protein